MTTPFNAFIKLVPSALKGNGFKVAIKDNIATKGLPTTSASSILKDYTSPYDATVVTLLKGAGIDIVGKTNMDEFAMGSTGAHSYFGATLNPILKDQVAGGSSAGSAAAVSGRLVSVALGTDTGGSVRLPSAFCNTLGFKPSYGRISRFGVTAFAQSLDTVGIFSKNHNDLIKIFELLDKYDPKDPTSLTPECRRMLPTNVYHGKKPLRIGIVKELCQEMNPTIKAKFLNVLESLLKIGEEIIPLSIPSIKASLPIYYTIAPSEAVSNLAKYDGIRYGSRGSNIENTRSLFGQNVKERLILGNYNLCQRTFNESYLKALKLRANIVDEFDSIFKTHNILTEASSPIDGVNLILSPTSGELPANIKQKPSGVKEYLTDFMTVPASLAGLPALSVPAEGGAGIQILGQFGDDHSVLRFGNYLGKLLSSSK